MSTHERRLKQQKRLQIIERDELNKEIDQLRKVKIKDKTKLEDSIKELQEKEESYKIDIVLLKEDNSSSRDTLQLLQHGNDFLKEKNEIKGKINHLRQKDESQQKEIKFYEKENKRFENTLKELKEEIRIIKVRGIDKTLVPDARGPDVVEVVVSKIQGSAIFNNDRRFLRRIALVETNDGEWIKGNACNGGIWQVNRDSFKRTTQIVGQKTLYLIQEKFQINWRTVEWEDLNRPLLSGLAARLILFIIETEHEIPWELLQQALLWEEKYTSKSNPSIDEFNKVVEVFEGDNAASSVAVGDIAFVVDSSGSIGSPNFDLVKRFIIAVCNNFEISKDGVRVGLITFSSQSTVEFEFGMCNSQEEVTNAVALVPYQGQGTSTFLGLEQLQGLMQSHRSGIPSVAVVLTDGRSNEPDATLKEAANVHAAGIEVFAVGVTSCINQDELKAIASHSDGLHCFYLNKFDELKYFIAEIKERFYKVPTEVLDSTSGSLGFEQKRFMRFDLPLSGVEIQITMLEGSANVYVSHTHEHPNDAMFFYKTQVNKDHHASKTFSISSKIEQVRYDKAFATIMGTGQGRNIFNINIRSK